MAAGITACDRKNAPYVEKVKKYSESEFVTKLRLMTREKAMNSGKADALSIETPTWDETESVWKIQYKIEGADGSIMYRSNTDDELNDHLLMEVSKIIADECFRYQRDPRIRGYRKN